MGTCEHDIKDAYEQPIPKTLKALLAKQTQIMFYSDNLVSSNCNKKFLCFQLFRVNEAEFILWVVSAQGHTSCGEAHHPGKTFTFYGSHMWPCEQPLNGLASLLNISQQAFISLHFLCLTLGFCDGETSADCFSTSLQLQRAEEEAFR